MKCAAGCGADLKPHEQTQKMKLGRETLAVPALCDACAKTHQSRPGAVSTKKKT